ncbi:MAG: copper homeostasis protein CutC [Paracoccaceae bacterium]|nr:copper homeostasis protein CutC [Paracoccaceae bacterium]
MGLRLEVCVDRLDGLESAVAGGADRIELCAALALGGLTPSAGVMRAAAGCGVPVLAMIRPRAGNFVWSEAEVVAMEGEIAAARAAGLAGVVLGASRPDGRLDGRVLARLVRAAEGMDLTLHRCFDLVPDLDEALEQAVALGFRRVLTSGGGRTADPARIGALVARAAGRIVVMAGSGVTAETAPALLAQGVRELHGSCSDSRAGAGKVSEMGFGPDVERRTSADRVRALKRVMEAVGGVQRHI